MMFRAQDIVRALRRYQRDQGRLPISFEELMKPGNKQQYFLRHLYKDPLVKGGKWGLLYMSPAGDIYDPHGEEEGVGTDAFGTQAQQTGGSPGQNVTHAGGSSAAGGTEGEGQGLPIAGVKSLSTDKPFRIFREQTEYDKWRFTVCDRDLLGNMALQCVGATTPTTGGGQPPPGGS